MDYGMIGQIAKAKFYAEERHRIKFLNFEVSMVGDNNTHTITYDQGKWHCTSSFFQQHGWSSHTVALERILKHMVEDVKYNGKSPAQHSAEISQIEKAQKYTDEPHRVKFGKFTAVFEGDNNTHTVTYDHGKWVCDSNFFKSHGWSSHTVALERILKGMVEGSSPEGVH
ncbi:MAG: hypothetical protein IAE83_13075 [Anaerolinea sp.]|nr:hypothetical protein [Anaerolinea sp.]MCC6972620.1 hypothetical protein [Anaerolineae bacterium]CAG0990434.1 hypothetical protein ANRL4_02436 [Anaerolineae bacterium]